MGVCVIVLFFVMLPIIAIALGPFNAGTWEYLALAFMGLLGGGGLLGTLYLIEPERLEEDGAH